MRVLLKCRIVKVSLTKKAVLRKNLLICFVAAASSMLLSEQGIPVSVCVDESIVPDAVFKGVDSVLLLMTESQAGFDEESEKLER